ncbi:MAG: type II toxin-antitoxin system RelE/ParE family toxin [Dehalococcoidia bacterium]
MRSRVTQGAVFDAVEAREWYALQNTARSQRFDEELRRVLERAKSFPRSGHPYLAGARRVMLRGFPYFVVYEVRDSALLIVAVAHTSRESGYWIGRD